MLVMEAHQEKGEERGRLPEEEEEVEVVRPNHSQHCRGEDGEVAHQGEAPGLFFKIVTGVKLDTGSET